MATHKLLAALEDAVQRNGEAETLRLLETTGQQSKPNGVLTIIANEGVHYLPDQYRRGEVLIASRGSLDFSSAEAIHQEFARILTFVAQTLKSREWRRVYIVPFGPSTLSMQLKLLVYRVTGLESIEVMQSPQGERVDVDIHLRSLILDSASAGDV